MSDRKALRAAVSYLNTRPMPNTHVREAVRIVLAATHEVLRELIELKEALNRGELLANGWATYDEAWRNAREAMSALEAESGPVPTSNAEQIE